MAKDKAVLNLPALDQIEEGDLDAIKIAINRAIDILESVIALNPGESAIEQKIIIQFARLDTSDPDIRQGTEYQNALSHNERYATDWYHIVSRRMGKEYVWQCELCRLVKDLVHVLRILADGPGSNGEFYALRIALERILILAPPLLEKEAWKAAKHPL